jgi:hypothetical protein
MLPWLPWFALLPRESPASRATTGEPSAVTSHDQEGARHHVYTKF